MRVYGVKRGHHAGEWYVILTSEGGTTTYNYVHTTNRRVNAERMARRLNAQANDER